MVSSTIDSSSEELTAWLASAPSAKAALYLGNAYLKLGQLDKAKAALERALELDPKSRKRDAIRKLIKGIDERIVGVVDTQAIPPGTQVEDAGAGDFVFVPRHAIHREGNPTTETSHFIVVRAGHGGSIFNVDEPAPATHG